MPRAGKGGPCRQRRRRGTRLVLRPGLLLLLAENDSHGYELMDQLDSMGFDLDCVDPSIIYRNLRDMEEMGLIHSSWDEEDSKGPRRRVYQISELGWQRLEDWLNSLALVRSQIDSMEERYQSLVERKERS